MSQESQEKPTGNTMSVGARVSTQLYRWVFTLKHKPEIKDHTEKLFQILKEFSKEFYFQLERGEEDGYLHYQGCFSLKNKEYMATVKNMLGDNTVHLEGCKDWNASKEYCKKKDTRVDGPFTIHTTWIKVITSFREWQVDLLEKLKIEPDDRTIVWYSDPVGGSGKTAMSKYLAVRQNAVVLTNGRTQDLAYAVDEPKVVILNFTRSNEDRINYGAIESIKDGLLFSGKYESKMKVFNSPHVIVFANCEPDYDKMSNDRWNVIHLSKKKMSGKD